MLFILDGVPKTPKQTRHALFAVKQSWLGYFFCLRLDGYCFICINISMLLFVALIGTDNARELCITHFPWR